MDVESRSMSDTQPYADLRERLLQFLAEGDATGTATIDADDLRALLDRYTALEGVLEQNATALNAFIYIIAQNFDSGGTYYWTRPPTHDEAQAAMEATNCARATLSRNIEMTAWYLQHSVAGDVVERVRRAITRALVGSVPPYDLTERAARAALEAVGQSEEGSITLDNASVQRLLDYGVLHYGENGWFVDASSPTPGEATLSDAHCQQTQKEETK